MTTPKSVLITGCTPGGLGHALALEFHKRGTRVFATARRLETLDDLRAKGIETFALDVTSDESIQAAVAHIAEATGGTLDILVNNAGVGYAMAATDLDISRVQALFNTNLFGVMRMVKAFAPLVISAKGKIVNNGSAAGTTALPFRSAYASSKAALHSYGDALRLELKPFDVSVITLVTAAVESVGAANDTIVDELPNSLYTSIMSDLRERLTKLPAERMSAQTWSAKVVSAVLGQSNPKWFWAGANAGMVAFMTAYFPRSVTDSIFSSTYGLSDMKKRT